MFSVLMSVYHKENEDFLEQSLNSLTNQSLIPTEIVLVKDGPLTPSLDNVIERFSKKNRGLIKILAMEKNVGLGEALKCGLLKTSHDIVARMDSDDYCYVDRFKLQYQYLCNYKEIDVVGSHIDEFDIDIKKTERLRKVPEHHESISNKMKWKNGMNHVTVMFRKAAVLESGNYNTFFGFEDYHLWVRMILKNKKFYNIQNSLVAVRVGNNMVGRRKGVKYFKKEFEFMCFLKKSNFISYPILIISTSIKFLIRISPTVIINFLYKYLLRRKK